MKSRRSTSVRDVARVSGTSLGTVSRVLNGKGAVSEEARVRVEAAILSLGYEPNAGARQIRSGRSELVGVLLPSLEVPFFGVLAQSIERHMFRNGYQSLICNTEEQEANELRYVSTLIRQQVAGIIIASVGSSENIGRLVDRDIPIIAVDRPHGQVDAVSVDHREGGRLMARHLLDLKHRRISIVGAPAHSLPIRLRVEGIREVLSDAGIDPLDVTLGKEHSFEACQSAAREIIAHNRPSAIIGTTDIAAIGAISAAHDAGLSLPRDLSVIGFDNLPFSAQCHPALTTVGQPIETLGELAAQQLLHRIDADRWTQADLSALSLSLIERASTAPPRDHG